MTEWISHSFKGLVEPGRAPASYSVAKKTYLDSEFEIDQDKFISLDWGRDPETNEHIQGSYATISVSLSAGAVLWWGEV